MRLRRKASAIEAWPENWRIKSKSGLLQRSSSHALERLSADTLSTRMVVEKAPLPSPSQRHWREKHPSAHLFEAKHHCMIRPQRHDPGLGTEDPPDTGLEDRPLHQCSRP